MNTNGMLIGLLVATAVGFALLILAQAKQIQVLKEENQRLRSGKSQDHQEKLIVSAREKLKSVGAVKTVKYVREQTGMSLLEAKQFVDRLEK